jgi:serine/threonine-protein phosphatase 2B catalytic subunit
LIEKYLSCFFFSEGPLCDILWADPTDSYDNEKLEQKYEMYTHNGPRGCSYNVSYKAICKFLDDNDLLCVIRAHQVQSAGCKMYKKHEKTLFPTLVTIFSAPNYCKFIFL